MVTAKTISVEKPVCDSFSLELGIPTCMWLSHIPLLKWHSSPGTVMPFYFGCLVTFSSHLFMTNVCLSMREANLAYMYKPSMAALLYQCGGGCNPAKLSNGGISLGIPMPFS